jgi:N-acetylmuramoyl-L-alanine amidase
MEITEDLLTINKYSRPGKKLKKIKGIVVHWTANPGTTATQNIKFFELRKEGKHGYGSAHYFINLDGSIKQCIPDKEMAYHVGAKSYTDLSKRKLGSYPNNCTIGIELCHPDRTGKVNKETYAMLVQLTSHLLKKYKLSAHHDVYRHYDITGKYCPKWFVDFPALWEDFLNDAEDFDEDSK